MHIYWSSSLQKLKLILPYILIQSFLLISQIVSLMKKVMLQWAPLCFTVHVELGGQRHHVRWMGYALNIFQKSLILKHRSM
ncbi:hypothetical protein LINGRAHAP2_LOCUS27911 [Linum grandiflorum]